MASSTCVRAAAMSLEATLPGREYCGKPPTTSTTQGAPSALASSTVRRVSQRPSIRPGVAHRPHRAFETDGRDLIAPGIDGADSVPRAGVDDLGQIALPADRRGIQ